MALKTTSILDDTVHLYRKTSLLSSLGVVDSIHLEDFSDATIPSAISEQPHQGLENDDYQIALVPRQEPMSSTKLVNPSAIPQVFLLPLTWQELLTHMRGELKSAQSANAPTWSEFGDVRVNFTTMQVMRFDHPVNLTAQQFKLLKFLMESPERVFSRDELLREVWGYNHYPSTRTVDNHICSLRRGLELNPERPIHFLTVRRIGYKFVP
jgi:transcriptional regulator